TPSSCTNASPNKPSPRPPRLPALADRLDETGAGLRSADAPGIGSLIAGLSLRVPFGRDPRRVDLDLVRDGLLRPVEYLAHQPGHLLRAVHAAMRVLDRNPGPARQHVFQMQRSLVAGRVDRLDRQVVGRVV